MNKNKKVFLERLKSLGYNQKTFSESIGRSEDALKKWNDANIPLWAWVILDLMEENNDYKEFFNSHKKINQLMRKYTI